MANNFERIKREFGSFIRQYKRKSHKSFDPNDRGYDRKVEDKIKRMNPEDLYKIMNDSGHNEKEEYWPFDDPENVAVFTSKRIIKDKEPILYVSHDEEDGAWQFHSGNTVKTEEAMIVSLMELYLHDSSIGLLADLPCGYIAERKSRRHPWERRKRT
jgi:hypothetical protein